jgi:hypothetical protein
LPKKYTVKTFPSSWTGQSHFTFAKEEESVTASAVDASVYVSTTAMIKQYDKLLA